MGVSLALEAFGHKVVLDKLMALQLWDQQVITIYPEEDMNVYTIFNGNL